MATATDPHPQVETVPTAGKESEPIPTPVVVASNFGPSKWPTPPNLPYRSLDANGEPLEPEPAYGDR